MLALLGLLSVLAGYVSGLASCEYKDQGVPIGVCWDVSYDGTTYISQQWVCDYEEGNSTATMMTYSGDAAGCADTITPSMGTPVSCNGDTDKCWCGGSLSACPWAKVVWQDTCDDDATQYSGGSIGAVGCFDSASTFFGDYVSTATTCTYSFWDENSYYSDNECSTAVTTTTTTAIPTTSPVTPIPTTSPVTTTTNAGCYSWTVGEGASCSSGGGTDSGAAEILSRFVFVFVAFAVLY